MAWQHPVPSASVGSRRGIGNRWSDHKPIVVEHPTSTEPILRFSEQVIAPLR